MLEELQLDTEGFSQIFRKARSQIAELYPQWNDYNEHDPGITLLELFAFLSEAQQFYLDQMTEEMGLAFLQLLGTRPKSAQSATLWVGGNEEGEIPQGCRFFAGDLCFQSQEPFFVQGDLLQGMEIHSPEGAVHREFFEMHPEKPPFFRCYPFGPEAKSGTKLILLCKEALVPQRTYRLSCLVAQKRNPIPPGYPFVPLANISLSYFDGETHCDLPFTDHSHGFLQDGTLSFQLNQPMKPLPQTEFPYQLQLRLDHSDYDSPPVLERLSFGDLPLVQEETMAKFLPTAQLPHHQQEGRAFLYFQQEETGFRLAEEGDWVAIYQTEFFPLHLLGRGNGFPSQRYPLSTLGILPDSVGILVEDEEEEGLFFPYERVEDFYSSSPDCLHFMIDQGDVVFGDGFSGYPPESRIFLVGLTVTQGERGNISKATPLFQEHSQTQFFSSQEGSGGEEAQTLEDCFASLYESLEQPTRLVSLEDIQTLVKETPGLQIQDCILRGSDFDWDAHPNLLHLVVKPFGSDKPKLSQAYRENILQHLEDKRLVGTYLKLHSPSYVTLSLYLEVYAMPEYVAIAPCLEARLRGYFAEHTGFGVTIAYHQLYRLIDQELGVSRIGELSVRSQGDGVIRKSNGDVILPSQAIVSLGDIRCVVLGTD